RSCCAGGPLPRRHGPRHQLLEGDLTAENFVPRDTDDALRATPQLAQAGVLAWTFEWNVADGGDLSIPLDVSRSIGRLGLEHAVRAAQRGVRGVRVAVPRREGVLGERLENLSPFRSDRSSSLQTGEE